MSNEPPAVDPPEILAIKRAFKKMPAKLSFGDGRIRFLYLTPVDFIPGVLGFAALLIAGFSLLLNNRIYDLPIQIWLSFLSPSLLPAYFYLNWLTPRLGATVILSKDGIGLEKSGKLTQFYKWSQINRMTVGVSPMSPIYIWSSTGLLGKIPTLFTVFSLLSSDYRSLQAAILTAYSGASAPVFRDHVSEFDLDGKLKWMRVIAPFSALFIAITIVVIGKNIDYTTGAWLLFAFSPWIPLSVIWLTFSLVESLSYENSKRISRPLSIISIGNSNLAFDLKNNLFSNATSRTTYRSNIEAPQTRQARFDSTILVSLTITTIIVIPIALYVVAMATTFVALASPLIILAIIVVFLGIYCVGFSSIRSELLVRRDSQILLQFDESGANVITAGKSIPVVSFGRSRIPFDEFRRNSSWASGQLRVNTANTSYYFSPSKMVSISDHELMNHLPEFD